MHYNGTMKFHRALALVLFVAWGGVGALFSADRPGTGRVIFVDGDVTANGQLAEAGDVLPGKTVLKTGPKAEIEVIFDGKNIFRLGPNTVAEVDFSQLNKSVVLKTGAFTSVLKQLARVAGSASFTLRAPQVNAGIRGTSFHVESDGNRTYFCTCNGSVVLDDGTVADEVTLTNAHHGARVFTKQDDGTVKVTPAGIEGHSDASVESLAQKIQVKVDWTAPDLSNH
jgi:hypothetical protein